LSIGDHAQYASEKSIIRQWLQSEYKSPLPRTCFKYRKYSNYNIPVMWLPQEIRT